MSAPEYVVFVNGGYGTGKTSVLEVGGPLLRPDHMSLRARGGAVIGAARTRTPSA
ncbi:hypothetical protein [Beutenbergia cavernae]|uniref:hypothetical protein n=1 Tax=Beutenbergia cavernae TaxID=84757 RepID=UPI00019AD28C|nr:hypothetical protein [Beutenbergia cavernae]